MPRSIRVRPDLIPRVKLAVKHNGFLRQKDFVEAVGLADSTVRNFLNGKPVDYATFREICHSLNLEWRDFADLGEIAKPPQESVESKAGSGENLMSFAASILEQIGFNQKFQVNRTSQYTGYRLKNPGERTKSYLLVLAQYKEGLGISISRNILNPYVLELKFYDDVWVRNEYGYDEADCQELNHLYWVIPSKEDIFLEISQDYKDIFSGESTGSFYLDPKGIDTDDVIHKDLQGFKLKRSEAPGFDWHFDHGDLLARLNQSDCCISMNNIDRLFPHTRKAYINSREILEEFIHYFGDIFMDNY
jgi:transcriptional regulator with XRE-family HTH domain